MKLLIMRHGDAEAHSSQDSARNLSELGVLEAQVMAKWLNVSDCKIDKIIVSPYVRAQQTAQHVKSILKCDPELVTLSMITPSGSAEDTHDFLDGMLAESNLESILIVSHMPLVSYLCAELTYDNQTPIFATAGIALIDYSVVDMKGDLKLLISPDDFCN